MPAIAPLAPERATLLARIPIEPLRYGAVSVAALAADTGAYLALAWLGLLPALAGGAGYVIGLLVHYLLSVRFVFDAQATGKSSRRLFVEFAASGVAGLMLTAAAIAFGTAVLGLSLLAAKTIAVLASFAAVYGIRRAIIFAAR